MSKATWAVQLTETARRDFFQAVKKSVDKFGSRQGAIYRETLLISLAALKEGPEVAGSIPHYEILSGLRVLHVARRGRNGRHIIVYRASDKKTIRVLRILHDAMDIGRHVSA